METPVIRLASALLAGGLAFLAFTGFPPPGIGPDVARQVEATRQMTAAARTNIERGEFALALPPAEKLHKLYPENHIYIEQLATVYNGLHRFHDEGEMWEQFLLHAPVPIEGCPQVGVAWRKDGQTSKALDSLKRCLAIEPNNPDVLYQLGYTSEHADPATSASYYREGLKHQPTNPDLILGLGRIGLNQGRAREATADASRVLSRNPDNPDAMLLSGLALSRLDRLAEARQILERGASQYPAYVDILLALANLAERRHDTTAAIEYYEKVVRLDAENREASFHLERLRSLKK